MIAQCGEWLHCWARLHATQLMEDTVRHTLLLGTLAITGCFNTTLDGKDGNLELSYTHGGLFESVANPIAAGLNVGVVVRDVASGDAIAIDSALSDDESVLTVDAVLDGGEMTLLAGAAGEVELSVTASDGLSDAFALTVMDIAAVAYDDPMYASSDEVYAIAAGASIWLPRDIEADDGTSLTGYGLALPDVSPVDAALALEDGAIGATQVQFFLPGEVAVSHAGGVERTYTVVDGTDVSWTVDDYGTDGTLALGAGTFVGMTGVDAAGHPVLGSLSAFDDSICRVASWLGSADTNWVEPLSEGQCTVIRNGNPEDVVLTYEITAE